MSGGEAASSFLCPGPRKRGLPWSRGVLCLLVVPGLSFGRGPAAEPVHQPGGVVPVHPRAGDSLKVSQGADRAGAERRAVPDALGLVQARKYARNSGRFSVVNYARITWARHARSLKLASYEPAVTPSPSCAGLIRDQYPVLGVSGGVPVYELLEFLVAVLGVVDCAALTPASSRSGTP